MKHPLSEETIDIRCAYIVGIVILVMGQKQIKKEQEQYIVDLVNNIGLDQTYLHKIWEVGKNSGLMEESVTKALDKVEYQYCFLIEVYKFIYTTLEYGSYLTTTFYNVANNFNIPKSKLVILENLCGAIVIKNTHATKEQYKACKMEKIPLSETTLAYFLEMDDFKVLNLEVLNKGDTLIVNKEYCIKETIKVLEGAKLIINHASVMLEGCIQVEGGILEIKNSFIKTIGTKTNYMISVFKSNLTIENTTFDGGSMTGVLCHCEGNLRIYNSIFRNTYYKSAMSLWNTNAIIKDSQFLECNVGDTSNGGAIYTNNNLQVTGCIFENCFAYMGAAIYRMATNIPIVATKLMKLEEKERMIQLFGTAIDFVPRPRNIQLVSYSIVLEENYFINCKAAQRGIVSLYKNHTLVNRNNQFKDCSKPNIYQYE